MADELIETPLPALPPEDIERRILRLDWRDLQLWCIAILILVVFAAGFLALISPQILWEVSTVLSRQEYARQLFFGLIGLLILLTFYLFQQRLFLLRTRRELIQQLRIAERTARTDALTGVYNRRLLDEALAREISRAERMGSKLSVMFVDVNDFKAFNTRFGHVAGDRILQDVATVLRKNFRASDLVTRYGGDEFLVIMPDTDQAQAGVAAERLAWWMERWNTQGTAEYFVTLTCGMATYVAGMAAGQLLEAADKDLYQQKTEPMDKGPSTRSPLRTPRL